MRKTTSTTNRISIGGIIFVLVQFTLGHPYADYTGSSLNARTDGIILSDTDKIQISEALRLRTEFGGAVWPGLAGAVIPLMIFTEDWQFLVGHPDPPDSWEKVEGDSVLGDAYFRSPAENTQAFAVRVGELWAGSLGGMDYMRLEMERQVRENLKDREITPAMLEMFLLSPGQHVAALLHETFHAFQAMHFPRRFELALSAYDAESRYPYDNINFKDSWNEEGLLLAKAFTRKDEREMQTLIRQFLDIRHRRRTVSGLAPDLVIFEQSLEWLEGLGKYAEMRFAELAAGEMGNKEKAKEYQVAFARTRYDMRFRLPKLGEQTGDLRFYLSGAVQSFLLDRLDPGWKTKFAAENVSLESLLAKAVDWPR